MAVPFPVSAYAVCSTPRTGSNYLCELLQKAQLGNPDEYLNPKYDKWGSLDFDNGYELAKSRSRFGVFGIKLHWEHRDANYIASDFDDLHPSMRWVFLRRMDVEAQALSWMTALDSDNWNHSSQPYVTVSEWRLDLFVRRIQRHNDEWCAWFRQRGIQPLKVVFEEFIDHPRKTVDEIREFVLA